MGEGRKHNFNALGVMRIFLLLIIVWCFSKSSSSQDVHFTQWWMNNGFVQPANINKDHDLFLQAGLKSQWNGVSGVPFQLQQLHLSMPVAKWEGLTILGAALRDKSGDGAWIQNKWNLGAAYLWNSDSAKMKWNTALLLRRGSNTWNNEAWQFSDDWNGLFYQEGIGQRERFLSSSAWGWCLSSAVQIQVSPLIHATFGINHFSSMQYQFKDGANSFLWASQQMYSFQLSLNKQVVHPIMVYSLFHKQKAQRAWLTYGEWGSVLDQRTWLNTTLWLGGGWRWNDALVLGAGCSWGSHLLRLTYDINVSPFRVATEYRGGWELQYQFQLQKPKRPKSAKSICPPFY